MASHVVANVAAGFSAAAAAYLAREPLGKALHVAPSSAVGVGALLATSLLAPVLNIRFNKLPQLRALRLRSALPPGMAWGALLLVPPTVCPWLFPKSDRVQDLWRLHRVALVLLGASVVGVRWGGWNREFATLTVLMAATSQFLTHGDWTVWMRREKQEG
jgi:hypothetical protein